MAYPSLKIDLSGTRLLLIGSLFLLLGGACSGSITAQALDLETELSTVTGDVKRGETLFAQPVLGDPPAPGCINCHGTTSDVQLVGPSLPDLSDYSTAYLVTSIIDPNAAFAENVRQGGMYNFYAEALSAQEVADLVAYLQAVDRPVSSP